MDLQTTLNMFFGIISAGAGWFAREMWAAVKELKSDLAKLREELPTKYVPKDDFKDGMKEIKDMLTRIFDKLDEKQDKP
jgi:hypothetical protein